MLRQPIEVEQNQGECRNVEKYQAAMADARSRARELTGLAGVELDEVLSVSEVVGGIPISLGVKSGMEGGGMTPGELELSTQIQVTFSVQ